ncbi:hypothetical protein D3C75_734150 [compost metagenome]
MSPLNRRADLPGTETDRHQLGQVCGQDRVADVDMLRKERRSSKGGKKMLPFVSMEIIRVEGFSIPPEASIRQCYC